MNSTYEILLTNNYYLWRVEVLVSIFLSMTGIRVKISNPTMTAVVMTGLISYFLIPIRLSTDLTDLRVFIPTALSVFVNIFYTEKNFMSVKAIFRSFVSYNVGFYLLDKIELGFCVNFARFMMEDLIFEQQITRSTIINATFYGIVRNVWVWHYERGAISQFYYTMWITIAGVAFYKLCHFVVSPICCLIYAQQGWSFTNIPPEYCDVPYEKLTPLLVAIEAGHLNIVKELVQKGADVNRLVEITNDSGERQKICPTSLAAGSGKGDIFNYLIENGANENIK